MNGEVDWVSILILALICVAIGYFLANLVQNLRNEQVEEQPEEVEGDGEELDRTEVVRVWRSAEGEILPELNGSLMTRSRELTNRQHADLSLALVDLYAWLETDQRPAPKVEAPPREKVREAEPTSEDGPPEQAGGANETEADVTAEPSLAPPGMNVFKSLVRSAQKEIKEKIENDQPSIAAQVDEILQDKLAGTDLADRAVRLVDLPNQGMVILIGLEKFEDLESVPDEEIKVLLKESVADWEARKLADSKR